MYTLYDCYSSGGISFHITTYWPHWLSNFFPFTFLWRKLFPWGRPGNLGNWGGSSLKIFPQKGSFPGPGGICPETLGGSHFPKIPSEGVLGGAPTKKISNPSWVGHTFFFPGKCARAQGFLLNRGNISL